ncbi:hypothetical protein [Bradyrhizobium cajani]|uniref:Uncharacterized protein n=1 Tax=Bradyrhizobium cajani TaxID=1928661 RepID=A0A844T9U8_9BRAD|nr:hypothetical protein [Bradyrhizobium cajani]MCP3370778.1 hypothetical protein [Bradyrhizobium cajani]MVT75883.1 hypothetical protein [Bradyrhizobium cajani]
MKLFPRLVLAASLIAGLAPAIAQVPPPVPALPDAERRTSYSISGSTCACAVGFQLYGDGTDYANWIEVFVNGAMVTQSGNWTITSPTGSLDRIPRPITDAVLTFSTAQTGTVQIVGARRPRRASQFSESRGVAARDLNQVITDLTAQNRETWDKINDVTGRSVRTPPGETLALLPVLASRANMGACFDSSGNLTSCVAAASGTFAAGDGITFTGTNPTTISVNADTITSGTLATARGGTGANNSTNSAGDFLISGSMNGTFVARSLNALCTLAPAACTAALGYTSISWYGAKCDGQFISGQNGVGTNLTINSGSPNLLSSAGFFTAADTGKRIWVPNAGVAGAGLSTTIQTVTDATHVVLAANASTTVTAFATTNAKPLVYGTDDTAAIQAAMTATPVGGILDIPGQQTGCLIRQQGSNVYALLQDHPFSIRGHGHFSNLMTFPDTPSTVDNLYVQTGSYDWANTVWENFSIGDSASFLPNTLLMYTRHGKRGLALVENTAPYVGIVVRNMSIGESGNDYSLYLGNSGSAQFNLIMSNKIWGGVRLNNVADSHRILYNTLQGSSTFGGLIEMVAGAGKFSFIGNNTTWAGGLKIESGFAPEVRNNYFEELYATSESNNAMVDFNGGIGTISFPAFTGNIVNAGVSTTSTPVRYANVNLGNFGDNTLSATPARTNVTSVTTLSCIAPNFWLTGGTHFSTALANSYAGC